MQCIFMRLYFCVMAHKSHKCKIFTDLPMPKHKQIADGNEDEIEDFVKKSSEQLQAKSAKKHKRVKIGVPSLTHVSTMMGTVYYVVSK